MIALRSWVALRSYRLTCLSPPCYTGSVPCQSSIYDECIATLCALGNQMGPRFITFDSLITRSIEGAHCTVA